ncbi:MAG: hypothetical protein Q4P72_04880 [Eubacteriales bacterium]|nr:hypothetical protein [Eubacteriales bacterium]
MKKRFYKQASTGIAFLIAMSFLVTSNHYQASETQGDETTEASSTTKSSSDGETEETSTQATSSEESSTSETSETGGSNSSSETTMPSGSTVAPTLAQQIKNPAYARFDSASYASQPDYAPERAAALRDFLNHPNAHIMGNIRVKLSGQAMGKPFNVTLSGDYAQNLATSARVSLQVDVDSSLLPSTDAGKMNLDVYIVPKLDDAQKMEGYVRLKSGSPTESIKGETLRFEFDRSAMVGVQANAQLSPEVTEYINSLTMKLKSSSPDEDIVTLLIPAEAVFKMVEADALKTEQTESGREQLRKGMQQIREVIQKLEKFAMIDEFVLPMEIHFGQDNKIHRIEADLGEFMNLILDFIKHEDPQAAKQLDIHISGLSIDYDLNYQDTEIPITVPEDVKNSAVDMTIPSFAGTTLTQPTQVPSHSEGTDPTSAETGATSEATSMTEDSSSTTEATSSGASEPTTTVATETEPSETSSPTSTANAATSADR